MGNERARKGIEAEEALRRWSEPSAYQAMIECSDAARTISTGDVSQRHLEYGRRRQIVESAFIDLLKRGTVIASGIEKYATGREVIEPSLWEVLEINYELDDIDGEHCHYRSAEFFEASDIPLNILNRPDWIATLVPDVTFTADPDYRNVTLAGRRYELGAKQALVVRKLHDGLKAENPWVSGKELLEAAGSEAAKIRDLFKSQARWEDLIESDRKGRYRLRV